MHTVVMVNFYTGQIQYKKYLSVQRSISWIKSIKLKKSKKKLKKSEEEVIML